MVSRWKKSRFRVGLTALSGALALGCSEQPPVAELDFAGAAMSFEAEPSTRLATVLPITTARLPTETPEPCAEGMVLVEGQYCPKVEQRCQRWMDPEGPYRYFRCAEYAETRCKSAERVSMRFCIDRDEYTAQGGKLPENFQSFTHASRTCKSLGKRVCRESEWNFACEGEAMQPYPYGFSRDASACNADHTDIVNTSGKLHDRRAPVGSHARCESPFGVRDMTGNLEEFVAMDGPPSAMPRPAMKGSYWQPGRNNCRAAQTKHDAYYNGVETGFRCCSDPSSDSPSEN